MGKAILYGQSANSELDFRVVGGTIAPASPAENTIWVDTSTPITDWILDAVQPTGVSGRVWAQIENTSSMSFNAIKKNTIQVCLTSCKQYVSGSWVDKTAKIYQNGVWMEPGIIFPPASDWQASKMFYRSDYTQGSCSFSGDVFSGSINTAGGSQGAGMVTRAPRSFADANTLHIEFSATGNLDGSKAQFCVYANTDAENNANTQIIDKVAGSAELSAGSMDIDVSSLSGSYYIFIGIASWATGQYATCSITKVQLR